MKILSSKKKRFFKKFQRNRCLYGNDDGDGGGRFRCEKRFVSISQDMCLTFKKKSSQKDENYESYALICNRDQKIMKYNFSHFFKNFQRPKVEAKGQMTMQWPWPLDQQPPWTI